MNYNNHGGVNHATRSLQREMFQRFPSNLPQSMSMASTNADFGRRGRTTGKGERQTAARAERVFRKLDLNGDGFLSFNELVMLLRANGEPEATAIAWASNLVGSMDQDRDRRIALGEFVNIILDEKVMREVPSSSS